MHTFVESLLLSQISNLLRYIPPQFLQIQCILIIPPNDDKNEKVYPITVALIYFTLLFYCFMYLYMTHSHWSICETFAIEYVSSLFADLEKQFLGRDVCFRRNQRSNPCSHELCKILMDYLCLVRFFQGC